MAMTIATPAKKANINPASSIKYRLVFYSISGFVQILLYLSLTFFIYATLVLLISLVFGTPPDLSRIYVIFPFGAFIPYQEWDPLVLLSFYALASSALSIVAIKMARDYPLASFLTATKVFLDSFPIVALVAHKKGVVVAFADANIVSYIVGHSSGVVPFVAILLGTAFVVLAEMVIVYIMFYRGVGSLPTAVKVMLKPSLGLALLTVIVVHEMGHVAFCLLFGGEWTGFGMMFPVSAFVLLKGAFTPEEAVLVSAGGNISVSFYMLLTSGEELRRSKFVRLTRVIGAQLTIFNALPAVGFVSWPLHPFVYTAIDGSKVLLYGLMSPAAFLLAVIATWFPLQVSFQTLKEESLLRIR